MSFANATYNFSSGDPPTTPASHHLPMPRSELPPLLDRQSQAIQPYHRDTPGPSLSFTPNSVIDPLMIDNLAKDFSLEPTQRANLHAFITVRDHKVYIVVSVLREYH